MKPLLASLLGLTADNTRPHFLWWTPGHNESCLTGSLTLHSQFHTFQWNHQKSLQWNKCASVLISVTFRRGATVGWFISFPDKYHGAKMFVCPVPKISQVMMKWCHRASHLGGFTLWYNGRRAKQPGLMHAPGVAHIVQRQWRTMLKK